ncbi:MAG: UvrB/UvrC motif-containing protein [Planctomycetes bacterium]|nr:UvrB/UvrC motif-containing protein [Planctomycetota bacterium]
MKCQNCQKTATLHITEVLGESQYEELHLCEDCAQKYLYEPQAAKSLTKAGQSEVDEGDESGTIGTRQCEMCGLKFVDFRNTGRLGCPHDYSTFQAELSPLLEGIHGGTRHAGKTPRRLPQTRQNQQELSKLRKQLHKAVIDEAYEEAARLRDRIRHLEEIA